MRHELDVLVHSCVILLLSWCAKFHKIANRGHQACSLEVPLLYSLGKHGITLLSVGHASG